MRIAASVRQEKDAFPARFCPDKRCLWRISTQRGEYKPCPKHMTQRLSGGLHDATGVETDPSSHNGNSEPTQ